MHAPLGHGGPEGAAAGVRSEHESQRLGGDRLEGHSAPTLGIGIRTRSRRITHDGVILGGLGVLPRTILGEVLNLPSVRDFQTTLRIVSLSEVGPELGAALVNGHGLTEVVLGVHAVLCLAPRTPDLVVDVLIIRGRPSIIDDYAVVELAFGR